MVVIVSCKNEEGPIKNLGAGRNSISSKHLCMSLKPARMKKIESKIKALEWPQHFFHYKSLGNFQDAQGQLTPQSKIGSS